MTRNSTAADLTIGGCAYLFGKLEFDEQPYGDAVGAVIDRPAVQCYEFAEIAGEIQDFSARAINDRPYVFYRKLFDKLESV